MSSLTNEQRQMIEEKKKIAQAKLAAKFSQKSIPQPTKISNNQCTLSTTGMVLSSTAKVNAVSTNYINVPQNIKSKLVCGACELTSKERFTVHVGYHKQLIDTFKTIQSKIYGKLMSFKTFL